MTPLTISRKYCCIKATELCFSCSLVLKKKNVLSTIVSCIFLAKLYNSTYRHAAATNLIVICTFDIIKLNNCA